MLKCRNLFNIETATQFGTVRFNEIGESRDLTTEQEQYLAERIQDFEFIEEKLEDSVVTEEEVKEETKVVAPDPEVKAPPKKRATRKKSEVPEK